MAIPYEQVLAEESEETQLWVKQRATELIAEELNLRELRRLRKLTQARLSKKLKIGQEGVSRIEKRTDLYLSTLRSYVEGVGGKLTIMAEFPDRSPVFLTGLGEDSGAMKSKKGAKKKINATVKSKPKSRRAA
jgi:hypothetical protein